MADAPVASLTTDAVVGSPAPSQLRENFCEVRNEQRPSQDDLDRLFEVAEACREPKEAFGRRLREIMGLRGDVRISKKYLGQHMTPTQHELAMAYYQKLLKHEGEEDVPDGPAPTHDQPVAPQGAPEAAPAATPDHHADPVGIDAARAKLRAEVATWGLTHPAAEIERIIRLHAPEKARVILWRLQLGPQTATEPLMAAAD